MGQATLSIESVSSVGQETAVPVKTERWVVIDMLRGIAMALMAMIHSAPFARTDYVAESQGRVMPTLSSLPHVLIGIVNTAAPPIFFALVGTSIALFENNRRKRGWSEGQITRFLLTRALILVILERPLPVFIWGEPLFTVTVLTAIAFAMTVIAFLRLLSLRIVAGVSVVLFFAYPLLVESFPPDASQPLSTVATILLHFHYQDTPPLFVEFPLLGWLILPLAGYVAGRLLVDRKITITPGLIWPALALLAAAGALRALGGYGNFTPYQPQLPFIYFFVESKQPPSMVYLLFNMAKALAVLALLQTLAAALQRHLLGRLLAILGQASLFFYVAHLPLYKFIGWVFEQTAMLPHPGIVRGLVEWGLGLLILFPLCAWYGRLRRQHPESLLRYL